MSLYFSLEALPLFKMKHQVLMIKVHKVQKVVQIALALSSDEKKKENIKATVIVGHFSQEKRRLKTTRMD